MVAVRRKNILKTEELLTSKKLIDLGLLHDCLVNAIEVNDEIILVKVNDINANTRGLPEYPGEKPAVIAIDVVGADETLLNNLKEIQLPTHIYEIEISDKFSGISTSKNLIFLKFWPSGTFSFTLKSCRLLFD